jgi:SagB-type dehydrogenase family enzyme
MRFRRSGTLIVTFESARIAVHNFLTKDRFTCSTECLDFLASLDEWREPEGLFQLLPDVERSGLAEQVTQLVEFNALVVEGTAQAKLDDKYRQEWQWGAVAGFYHFSIRNTPFLIGKPARAYMRKRKAWRPSPPLYQSNNGRKQVVELPTTDLSKSAFSLMRRRRSQREFSRQPISLEILADCLFTANGVVDFYEDEDYGKVPVTMTPSGGARNPFELYVYAQRVQGLAPGFYHYAALDHDLGLVRNGKVNIPKMLAGQEWPAEAAAIIFMVAYFSRSMWKYHLPTAYRVVLMEAGFIGQNIALTATHHGLSAVPSGALNESLIEKYLGTPAIEAGVVLSMSIGDPKQS